MQQKQSIMHLTLDYDAKLIRHILSKNYVKSSWNLIKIEMKSSQNQVEVLSK